MYYDGKRVYNNLLKLIEDRGMKIGDFENEAGVSAGYISRTFKDGAKPNINFLINAAEFFDTTIDCLLFRQLDIETPDEKKKLDFLVKLIADTWDSKLNWITESSEHLNTRVYQTKGSACTHPLFSYVNLGIEGSQYLEPVFISHSYDTNTRIYNDCYNLGLPNGATLYIMNICKASASPEDEAQQKTIKEIWMVFSDGARHFLCDSTARGLIGYKVTELYASVNRAANCPKSPKDVDDVIDAYLNDLPFNV